MSGPAFWIALEHARHVPFGHWCFGLVTGIGSAGWLGSSIKYDLTGFCGGAMGCDAASLSVCLVVRASRFGFGALTSSGRRQPFPALPVMIRVCVEFSFVFGNRPPMTFGRLHSCISVVSSAGWLCGRT